MNGEVTAEYFKYDWNGKKSHNFRNKTFHILWKSEIIHISGQNPQKQAI